MIMGYINTLNLEQLLVLKWWEISTINPQIINKFLTLHNNYFKTQFVSQSPESNIQRSIDVISLLKANHAYACELPVLTIYFKMQTLIPHTKEVPQSW